MAFAFQSLRCAGSMAQPSRKDCPCDQRTCVARPSQPVQRGMIGQLSSQQGLLTRIRRIEVRTSSGNTFSGDDSESETSAGSDAWRRRPGAVSLPSSAQKPEAWFILAGFLKIVMVALPVSWYGDMFSMLGYPIPGGPLDIILMVPVAVALALLARFLLQNGFDQKRWFARVVFGGSLLTILLCNVLFGSSHVVRTAAPQRTAGGALQARPRPPLPTAADADALGVKWGHPTEGRRGGALPK